LEAENAKLLKEIADEKKKHTELADAMDKQVREMQEFAEE